MNHGPDQSWTNHAYLILAHDNLPTLNALIDALSETGTIYIHLDKKSRINPQHITHGPPQASITHPIHFLFDLNR